MEKTLTTIQEVFFDLCDLLENNDLDEAIDGFEEFSTLREFVLEQREKLSQIEEAISE